MTSKHDASIAWKWRWPPEMASSWKHSD